MTTHATLFDVSWEVCNMVGGIHTVLATKLAAMRERYGDEYIAIGPDIPRMVDAKPVFREELWEPRLIDAARAKNVRVRMGRWLLPGEPRCLLVSSGELYGEKDAILAHYWDRYKLDSLFGAWDYFDPLLFAHAAGIAIEQYYLIALLHARRQAVVHCHEWMATGAILYLKEHLPEIGTVFTTHATMLGRALAANRPDPEMYRNLSSINSEQLARELGVASKHSMETVSARVADVFTTVSSITARECDSLLGRAPDVVTPNGLGDQFPEPALASPDARHRARNRLFDLAELTTGDRYDRDHTALLLSSGRYEFGNKGLDVYVHALNRLGSSSPDLPLRVIAFVACPAGHTGPNREILGAARRGERQPNAYKCTHDLREPDTDPIQRTLRTLNFENCAGARVHIIQVPIYLDGTDPLIPEHYYQLLAGFDLTVFPSCYEPWGYTPLESVGFGVPTATSDLAGFGRWVTSSVGAFRESGVQVLARDGETFDHVVAELEGFIRSFAALAVQARAALGEAARSTAAKANWREFAKHYFGAHDQALAQADQRGREMSASRFAELAQHHVVVAPSAKGGVMAHMQQFVATAELPKELAPLRDLARNLYWTWHPEAWTLFEKLDPKGWAAHRQAGPLAFLESVAPEQLARMASSQDYLRELERAHSAFLAYVNAARPAEIGYFCMEFGLAAHLHIYSGGLGMLAGDHLKSASDLNLPLCAVGLAYKKGYFRQRINAQGEQEELDDTNDFRQIGGELVQREGQPVIVDVAFPGRTVAARAWKIRVGRIPLYLLDTDCDANRPEDRQITDHLYGGDQSHRIQQEMVLGVGGYALLRKLGFDERVYHLNEGHSALLILGRLRHLIQVRGLKYGEALDFVRHTTIFTTHTPVPAGHDRFDETLVRPYLAPFEEALRRDWSSILGLGQSVDEPQEFGTTNLAVRGSLRINAVSKIHGRVTRQLFQNTFPGHLHEEIPIGSITNGVHETTWLAPRWQHVFVERFGADWVEHVADVDYWERVRQLDDGVVWETHRALKAELTTWLKAHIGETWPRRRELRSYLSKAQGILDDDPLIIAFARRFAPYKRADLIFADLDRLAAILRNAERPVVLAFAGKAHPADGLGKGILSRIAQMTRDERLLGHVLLLEGYDIRVAHRLVAGSDIWLNTPTRPLEASGTSGMKAAMNGCLNLSVADGWWAEGYNGRNGWVIGSTDPDEREDLQNEYDAKAMLALLESEVVPLYHKRDRGLPLEWIAMMKESIATSVPLFSTRRMVAEYRSKYYEPALTDAHVLRDKDFEGLYELRELKQRLVERWGDVAFGDVRIEGLSAGRVAVGRTIPVRAQVRHPGLEANLLEVQVVISRGPMSGKLERFETLSMSPKVVDDAGGTSTWETEFRCDTTGTRSIGLRIVPRGVHAEGDVEYELNLVRWM